MLISKQTNSYQFLRNQTLQVLAFVCMLLSASPFLHAQATAGAISGTVTDPTGAAVSGAKVTITDQGTAVSHAVTTDNSGFYSVEGLSVGLYTVSVSSPGFKESVTKGIQLDPGQRRANNLALTVGSATSEVTVEADAQQVNTESSESGGTISGEQINNLMLNGRNFQTLAIAVPGVSSTAGADALNGGGLEGTTSLIVNGQSVEYTTYTIDGIYNMNSGNLANVDILPIVDGISEFSVLKDNYSAQYGFAGSGQVVVQTKSGTDTFHGSAWEYIRNNAFDANNYYSTSTQALHQNIFGYTLGGPLIIPWLYNTERQKKTFFFASNQWYIISAGQVLRGAVFPTEMRGGNLSESPTLPSGGLTLDANSQALLAAEGKTNCITSPTSLNPACLDPVAVALLSSYVPPPNNTPNGFLNYVNQGPLTTSQLDYQYRLDHQITTNNQFTSRIMYEPVTNGFPYSAWGGTPFPGFADSYYTGGFNGMIRVASTITPKLLNTAGVAETFTHVKIGLKSGNGQMPDGVSITQAFPGADIHNRIPNIAISEGWTGFGVSSQPILASDGEGIISDDVSWIKGSHIFQAGAVYMFGIKRQDVFTNPQGSFTFTGVHTGDPAADYLLGLDSTYNQSSSQRHGAFHYRQGETYLQDDWKATHRLTLNLGLRWVYFSNDTASGDQVTSFSPAAYDATQAPVVNVDGSLVINSDNQPLNSTGGVANLLNGLVFAGKNGTPDGFFTPVKSNFGPRVGFAYDVFGDGKTSIRGGYGIGYTRVPLEQVYSAFGQNAPYNQTANVLNSLLSNGIAGTTTAPTTQTLNDAPLNFKPAQIQSYSLTLQRELRPNTIASIAYVGSQGRHLTGGADGNFALPVTALSVENCLPGDQAASSGYDFDPCINSGTASPDYTRPYKGYSAMSDMYDEGSSNYNSLQSSITHRTNASQFSVSYTYSKALATVGAHGAGNTTSNGAGGQNPRNFHAEYGPPAYDFTNDVTGTWVYSIPSIKRGGKATELALGGWNFAGMALHQSGFAMSPGMATSTAGLATRPDQTSKYQRVGKLNEWFDPSSFTAPKYGSFGSASNGIIRGPAYSAINASFYKTFSITERLKTQLRAEAFNIVNHPNFEGVATSYGSANFGQVTSARDPRILEFAVKLFY